MSKCSFCGTELLEGDLFCHSCGSPVESDTGIKPPQQEQLGYAQSAQKAFSGYSKPITTSYQPLIARKFILWYLLSMLFGPLIYVYLYFNFQDLDRLYQYNRPSSIPAMNIDINKIFIIGAIGLFCGFGIFYIPYIYYLKWEKLHRYIEHSEIKPNTRPASGKQVLVVMIVNTLISIVAAVLYAVFSTILQFSSSMPLLYMGIMYVAIMIPAIIFGIYFLIQSYRWQEAYNEIAFRICPNTIRQDLF